MLTYSSAVPGCGYVKPCSSSRTPSFGYPTTRKRCSYMFDAVRRKNGVGRVGSLPEDGHHCPTDPLAPGETPEQWLLAKEHAPVATAKRSKGKLAVPYLGLEVTPELVAISMVYFVQGILGLSRLALSFFFKDDLGVEPAQVAVLVGLAGLPWVVKPLYGFISDSIPLFGYRRRSYLMLCGLAGSLSWLSLATVVNSPPTAVAAMLLGSLSTACSDVVVDSLVVERAREESASTAGSLQSLCWASSAVGGIASAYFSGSLVQDYGSHTVFAITAVFPLIVSASALLIDEQRVARSPAATVSAATAAAAAAAENGQLQHHASKTTTISSSSSSSRGGIDWSHGLASRVRTQAVALWGAVKQRHILLPTIFVFLWQATPTADSAMFYFYTNQLHFQPEFLGRVRLAGSIASLAGVALYNSYFKTVPLKKMFLWVMLLGVGLGSTQLLLVSGANRALGLSDELFVLGDSVILTVLGQVSFMPILVLAARLCPEGVEATLFATLMSILNGGSFTGSALGAGLTSMLGVTSSDFSNLFLLVLICNVTTLLPAPFLGLLPSSLDQDAPESGGSSSSQGVKAAGSAGHSSSSRRSASPAGDEDGFGMSKGRRGESTAEDMIDEEVGLPLLKGRIGWDSYGNGSKSSERQEQQQQDRKVKGR